jgi:hypothetical protein
MKLKLRNLLRQHYWGQLRIVFLGLFHFIVSFGKLFEADPFVRSFYPSFLGLYGDAQATAQTAKAFGVSYEKQYYKKGGYTFLHSDGTFLIGTKGQPLLLSRYGQQAELLVQDIRLLLAADR